MRFGRKTLAAFALAGWLGACAAAPAFQAPADTRYTLDWVLASGDHEGRPFAIVDKKAARLFVFTGEGTPLGDAPVLLGQAAGDRNVPGVGALEPSQIPLADRTTPAGRFDTEPGRNLQGEDVVWFDYDQGLAIHRVRPGASLQPRLQRLASDRNADRRVSLGCVVVPVEFYLQVVMPALGHARGVVYVLPEDAPVQAMFGRAQLVQQQPPTLR